MPENNRTTTPKSPFDRLLPAFIWGGALAACFSCKKDEDKPEYILPEKADTLAPLFIAEPKLEAVEAGQATVSFGLDEDGDVVALITDQIGLSLAPPDLFALAPSEDNLRLSLTAHKRKFVTFRNLKPGSKYRVLLAAEDRRDNRQTEVASLDLTTAKVSTAIRFTNDAPTAREGMPWSFKPQLSEPRALLALEEAPTWLTWDQRNFSLSGIPDTAAFRQGYFSFILKVSSPNFHGERRYRVQVTGDPLHQYAWHVKNTGQSNFAWFTGKAGVDANLGPAAQLGLTGARVKVRIVGPGLQVDHPDLIDNVDPEGSANFTSVGNPSDPSPIAETGRPGDMGTSQAGIIAAMGWNGIGSRGIAPNAKVNAHKHLGTGATMEPPEILAGTDVSAGIIGGGETFTTTASIDGSGEHADVMLLSFGTEVERLLAQPEPKMLYQNSLYVMSEGGQGREGKGTVFIKPAGEGHLQLFDANMDTYSVSPHSMVIGSVNALGYKSLNSLAGANLWISAPGGEAGYQSDISRLDGVFYREDFTPGLITTDATSAEKPCEWGFSKQASFFQPPLPPPPQNADPQAPRPLRLEPEAKFHTRGDFSGFNIGWSETNPNCDYTATIYKGSYGAAAVTAGVVALILERNEDLTWRDVKHILAETARPVDEKIKPQEMTINHQYFVRLPGWITNAAGFRFHNYYGFGIIDAAAAIELADPATYVPLPKANSSNAAIAGPGGGVIPEHNSTGVTQEISFEESIIVESVQLDVNITHDSFSHIGIELTSPSRTTSIMLPTQNGGLYPFKGAATFLSNAFYGEPARGKWIIRVIDGKKKEEAGGGTLNSWAVTVRGHSVSE